MLQEVELESKPEITLANSVCPGDLIRADYRDMLGRFDFALEHLMKQVLIPQSIVGHCLMGHAKIPESFPNTTIDDVVQAIGRKPKQDKEVRQDYMDMFTDWLFSGAEYQSTQHLT